MKTDEIQAAAGSRSVNARRLMGATGRWSASVLRSRRSAAVGSSTLNPSQSKWVRWDFGTVRVVLAAVLLLAAALKGVQLWSSSPQPFAWPKFAPILLEFAFVAWLLTGWLPRVTWWLAVACFTTFALVALGKILQGEPDCGCFGAVRTTPLFALVVDLAALAALLASRLGSIEAFSRSAVVLVALLLVTSVPLFLRAGVHRAYAVAPLLPIGGETHDFGEVPQGAALTHEFQIANRSGSVATIAGVTYGCSCLMPSGSSRLPSEVRPGEIVCLPVLFRPGFLTDVRTGSVKLEYLIDGRASDRRSLNLKVRARVRPTFALSAGLVDFGPVDDRSPRLHTRTISVSRLDRAPFAIRNLYSTVPAVKAEVLPCDAADRTRWLRLTLDRSLLSSDRALAGSVVVTTDCEVQPKVFVEVRGQFSPIARSEPPAIVIPSNVSGAYEESLVIHTTRPSRLVGVDATSSQITTQTAYGIESCRHNVVVHIPDGSQWSKAVLTVRLDVRTNADAAHAIDLKIPVYRFSR